MKLVRSRITWLAALGLILIITPLTLTTYQANAQNDVVSEIKAHLMQNHVPVKTITIKSRIPFQLEVIVQSKSQDTQALPDDPIFQQAVHREIAAARRRGTKIETVKVILVNSLNQDIYWSELPVDKAIDVEPISASLVEDKVIATEIRNRVPLKGMILTALDITKDTDGVQSVSLKLSVKDIKTANNILSDFMPTLSKVLRELQSQKGAQIATYTVDIVDDTGKPLLKYVKDYMPSEERESWWQAPDITQEWFPHPAPSTP